MPVRPIKAKEQYRLVMKCRSSGLTDHQWCREKGICPGTFYDWVRRIRQKGYQDIPEPVHSQRVSIEQKIVTIEPDIPALPDVSPPLLGTAYPAFPVSAIELLECFEAYILNLNKYDDKKKAFIEDNLKNMAISLAEVSPNDEADYAGDPDRLHEYSKRIIKLIDDCGTIQKAVHLANISRAFAKHEIDKKLFK